jgi:hypothetical protein
MAKVQLTQKYASPQFKRLKLKNGETARIALLDPEPEMAYQHWVVDHRGVLCVGREEVLASAGSDPDVCPLCRVAQPGKDALVSRVRRYFAMPVFRYNIDSSKKPIIPISGEVWVWVFGENKFARLVSHQEEYGDLRKRDLRLDCEPNGETFQKMDIKVTDGPAAWLRDEETRNRIAAQFAAERPKSLEAYLGRRYGLPTLEEIAANVTGRRVHHVVDDDTEAAASSLLAGLDEISVVEALPAGNLDLNDLLK